MLKFAKPIRIRDKRHLAFARTLPCVKCTGLMQGLFTKERFIEWDFSSEPSHIRLKSKSGTGIKPCDSACLPLCHPHHMDSHRGEATFWGSKLDSAIELAKKLYEVSGDRLAAIKLIKESKI